jgi:acetyl esterase/lipase
VIADLAFREVDGWRGAIDLYLPEGSGPHPVLLYLHGGGWRVGSKAAAAAHAPYWCAMGLAVASASYRLVGTAPAPAAMEDTQAAFDWLIEHGSERGFDPGRIIICGHSAGAVLALAAAYRHNPAPAAVIGWSAHGDLLAYHETRNARGEPMEWLAKSVDPDGYAHAFSPLHLVRPGLPPTLLIHSDRDPIAAYDAVTRLAGALTEAGADAELVTMRSDFHLPPEHPVAEVERAHALTRDFLARHGLIA